MDPSNSTEETKKSLTTNQKLVIGGVILAGLAALLVFYFVSKRPNPLYSDPPPIIVKSGSFDLESIVELQITNGGGSTDIVTYSNFPANKVRIQRFNKDESRLDELYDGAIETIQIWIEEYSGPISNVPTFKMEVSGNVFTLTSQDKLKKARAKHPNRSWKIKDDNNNKTYRFQKIQYGATPIIANYGDEFFITYYQEIRPTPTPTP